MKEKGINFYHMSKYNILIVEDEYINAKFIEKVVIKLGHNIIETVETAQEAIAVVKNKCINIIFMDINLEGSMDGISCAKVINKIKKIPIIYTTAFGDSQTMSEAMETNLFGYLIKPFDSHDVEAVLNITIKQNYPKNQSQKNFNTPNLYTELNNEYTYYEKTHTLKKDDKIIELTKKESDIFYYLFKNINQAVSVEALFSYVWNNKVVSSSTIRNTISHLRQKVPNLTIRTISSIGYALENE